MLQSSGVGLFWGLYHADHNQSMQWHLQVMHVNKQDPNMAKQQMSWKLRQSESACPLSKDYMDIRHLSSGKTPTATVVLVKFLMLSADWLAENP